MNWIISLSPSLLPLFHWVAVRAFQHFRMPSLGVCRPTAGSNSHALLATITEVDLQVLPPKSSPPTANFRMWTHGRLTASPPASRPLAPAREAAGAKRRRGLAARALLHGDAPGLPSSALAWSLGFHGSWPWTFRLTKGQTWARLRAVPPGLLGSFFWLV